MGGKSSSTTTSTTQQTVVNDTKQADASGVITGNVLQGEIQYTEQFPDAVAEFSNNLIALLGHTIDLAAEAGGASLQQSSMAIEQVAARAEAAENPSLGALGKVLPLGFVVAAAYVAIKIWGKK